MRIKVIATGSDIHVQSDTMESMTVIPHRDSAEVVGDRCISILFGLGYAEMLEPAGTGLRGEVNVPIGASPIDITAPPPNYVTGKQEKPDPVPPVASNPPPIGNDNATAVGTAETVEIVKGSGEVSQ